MDTQAQEDQGQAEFIKLTVHPKLTLVVKKQAEAGVQDSASTEASITERRKTSRQIKISLTRHL